MLKRGLVTDLARMPHSLDMSSPLMAFTVNAALKPLEALSRIVNLPPATAAQTGRPVPKPKPEDGRLTVLFDNNLLVIIFAVHNTIIRGKQLGKH